MKREKRFYWGISLLVIILLAGCKASTGKSVKAPPLTQTAPRQASGDILATVGDRIITLSEFQEGFNAVPPERRQGATVEEQKEKALEDLVQMTLFSLESRAQKIDGEESIARTILNVTDSILAGEYYKREVLSKATVTEDEIKKYYDSHPDEFTDSGGVRGRHILIKVDPNASPEDWANAEAMARNLRKEIDNGADFAKLARKTSDDGRTKGKGGDFGYITREKMPEGFPDIVFSLEAGELSDPVKSPKGYHIIKVETKQPERIRTLDQVKGNLKRKLTEEKRKALFAQAIERLKKKYNVTMNTDLLPSVKVDPTRKRGG